MLPREKTGLQGFRPGPTQTGLYNLRKRLEACNFGFKKKISGENKGADPLCSYCTADLRLCFRMVKTRLSHDVAYANKQVL